MRRRHGFCYCLVAIFCLHIARLHDSEGEMRNGNGKGMRKLLVWGDTRKGKYEGPNREI